MNPVFWRLPGPGTFLDRAVELIREGISVVLVLPDTAPQGVPGKIVARLGDLTPVEEIQADADASPIEELFRALAPFAAPETLHNVPAFVAEAGAGAWVAHLRGLTAPTWPAWRRLVEVYARESLRVPPHRRGAFLLALGASLGALAPDECPSLSVLPWRGVAGELDMLAFVEQVMPKTPDMPRGLRALLVASVVNLALWDVELAERLAAAPPADILLPDAVLRQYAYERGWISAPPTWENGGRGLFEGNELLHSAWLCFDDADNEIGARLWRAQAGSLLPLVEMQRRVLVPQVERWLALPMQTEFGVIANPMDLEIGQIAYQLRYTRCDPLLYQQVLLLREVRNELAHFHPLPPEIALRTDLYGPVSSYTRG